MSGNQRRDTYSLQLMTEFDACEQVSVGSEIKDLTFGNFGNITNTPARINYYCRGIYNSETSSLTVTFILFGDLTSYVAEIPSGQWHFPFKNIQAIYAVGTDSGTVRLGYFLRGKVDGTGNL